MKSLGFFIKVGVAWVTSHTEVWIEIILDAEAYQEKLKVTSHTEVWIEIPIILDDKSNTGKSPPIRRCGLKFSDFCSLKHIL